MALKATIFKAELQIANMDRQYYADHALTLARHPSETDERMMMRLLAFICHANDALSFGKGLSADDEPDLWQKDLTGAIERWIEVGQPDERRLLKAAGRASQVAVYSYGNTGLVWWKQTEAKIARAANVSVFHVASAISNALAAFAERTMRLQCTIQDGQIWLNNGSDTVLVEITPLRVGASHSQ